MNKYCLACVETLVQSPVCGIYAMVTPATKATEAAAPQTAARDTCTLEMHKTFLTQKEINLEHAGMCCHCY